MREEDQIYGEHPHVIVSDALRDTRSMVHRDIEEILREYDITDAACVDALARYTGRLRTGRSR